MGLELLRADTNNSKDFLNVKRDTSAVSFTFSAIFSAVFWRRKRKGCSVGGRVISVGTETLTPSLPRPLTSRISSLCAAK